MNLLNFKEFYSYRIPIILNDKYIAFMTVQFLLHLGENGEWIAAGFGPPVKNEHLIYELDNVFIKNEGYSNYLISISMPINLYLFIEKDAVIKIVPVSEEAARLKKLRDKIINGILEVIPKAYLNGHPDRRLPHDAHLRFDYIEGESLILSLKDENIAAATGSACSSKTLEPSHTLIAMGLLHEEAHGSLVITLGRYTKEEDVDKLIKKLPEIVKRLRLLSPLTPPDLLELYNEVNE